MDRMVAFRLGRGRTRIETLAAGRRFENPEGTPGQVGVERPSLAPLRGAYSHHVHLHDATDQIENIRRAPRG